MAEIKIPSNSNASKGTSSDKKFTKVTKGKITVAKKSPAKKFADIFIAGDINQVKKTIIYDMILPAGKNLLLNVVNSAFRMILFNDQRGVYNSPQNGYYQPQNNGFYPSQPSYASYYTRNNSQQYSPQTPTAGYSSDQTITFASREDAECVLGQMINTIATYRMVSVADFYDLVGVTTSYTDNAYGWYDLSTASIRATAGGYVIDFPNAVALRR